jgi:hypothetical protein
MKVHQATLEDLKVNVKLKLASAWTSFMFLYLYVDYFHLYMPGVIEDILAGKVFVFDITQEFVLGGLISVSIPALMVFLSVTLPAKSNRWTNLIVAMVYIPYSLANVIGEEWIFFYWLGAVVELVLLLLIIRHAWMWPRQEGLTSG